MILITIGISEIVIMKIVMKTEIRECLQDKVKEYGINYIKY